MRSRAIAELALFAILVFSITWGIVGLFVFVPEQIEQWHGPMNESSPAFYMAVYAPTFSALLLTALLHGRDGLKLLFRGLSPRVHIRWWAAVFLGYPALFLLWHLASVYLVPGGAAAPDWRIFVVDYPVQLLLLWPPRLVFDPGPVGEEFGWRGFALPRLLTLMPALDASIVLGLVWGIWHFPAYVLGDDLGRAMVEFPWFVLSLTSISVLFTWIFKRTGGNFLLGGVFAHLTINACASAGMYPDMPTVAGVTTSAAVVLAMFTGRTLGSPAGRPRNGAPEDAV